MLSSLVELLEEKGILTQEEYEKRIMEKAKSNRTKQPILYMEFNAIQRTRKF